MSYELRHDNSILENLKPMTLNVEEMSFPV